MDLPVITLSTARRSRHPWIYRKMVRRPRERLEPGALVEIRARTGEFAGRGIYNPKSEVAVRVLTEDPAETLGPEFFRGRLARAGELRQTVLRIPERSDAYRLVHGEADGLSGLVVDRFADVLVVKPYSAGYVRTLDWLVDALGNLYPGSRVVARADETTARREGFRVEDVERRFPPVGRVAVREHDLRMEVDLASGHKTGYFLDQRDNRRRLAELVRGMKVLDCFSYTGGFAISAMLAGAASATAVELDEKALDVGRRNAALNGVQVEFVHRDVFDCLRDMLARGEEVDAIVLDPAKLAAVRAEVPRAMRTYGDMNRLAFQVVRDGGLVLSCSCSGLVSEGEFLSIISRSAAEAGATLQIFAVTGAAPDHPVSSIFPEGRYLKAVFSRVARTRRRQDRP